MPLPSIERTALKEIVLGAMLYVLMRHSVADAAILSGALCRGYRNVVDNELFLLASAVSFVGALFAAKTAEKKIMGSVANTAVGLTAALNLENVLQMTTGSGFGC